MNEVNEKRVVTEDEIDLLELAFELLSHWKFIIFVSVISACIAAAINVFVLTPVYESTAELYILDNSTSISSLADIQIGNNLVSDYVQITSSRPVLDAVIENLGLEESYKQLAGKVSVKNDSNTHILKISVKDGNVTRAKLIADETARVAKSFIADKMGQKEPSILHYGYSDGDKVSPRRARNVALAGMGGFAASSALIIVLFLINDSIKGEEDVENKLGLTVLGSIPYEDGFANNNTKKKDKKKGGKK